jgi:hypothetical protein
MVAMNDPPAFAACWLTRYHPTETSMSKRIAVTSGMIFVGLVNRVDSTGSHSHAGRPE